jgi:hypothetical protein
VNASVESAGARDEVPVSSDDSVPLLSINKLVASNVIMSLLGLLRLMAVVRREHDHRRGPAAAVFASLADPDGNGITVVQVRDNMTL